ncbi:MAG: DUF2933 domain-containing protein [Candidatus Saccharibacteria bacterium]
MKRNTMSHVIWMIGGFIALVVIDKIFKLNLIYLFPFLCLGMMIFMLKAMSKTDHDKTDHE